MALTLTDFKLGRIAFPTIEEGFKEAVGDSLEVVGAGLAAGERKPRPFDLTIPVRASSSEPNPYTEGDRMRRQVRALMENPTARLSGLFMKVAFDPEQNGWLLLGGGSLDYAEGGLAFADYKLSLSDSYIVGKRRTHRPARRVSAFDRRLGTTPRDIERLVYSTAFAGTPAVVKVALPHGASDVRARNIALANIVQTLSTADGGSVVYASGVTNGDVVSFEQAESAEGLGDVTILDRRGNKAPAEVMTIKEPQASFGWEEVYGTDYPLTEGDVPTIQNGLCRTRLVTQGANLCIAIDQFSGGAWVERSRMMFLTLSSQYVENVIYTSVVEWTPERAVIFFRGKTSGSTVDVYMILQRGWTGPRFEIYTRPTTGTAARPRLSYFPSDSSNMLFANSAGIKVSSEAWSGASSWAENDEPWGVLAPLEGGGIRHAFTFGSPPFEVLYANDGSGYGTVRKSVHFLGSASSTVNTGWVGIDVRLDGTEPVRLFESETYRNTGSGTTSEVSEGAASGGKAVQETQASEVANTLVEPTATTIGLVVGSSYAVWARVRVGTAGATGTFHAKIGAEVGEFKTTTSTTYVWVYMGVVKKATASALAFSGWRSAGTGNVFVDRVAVIPAELASDDGLLDIGQASLYDAQGIAELVTR